MLKYIVFLILRNLVCIFLAHYQDPDFEESGQGDQNMLHSVKKPKSWSQGFVCWRL